MAPEKVNLVQWDASRLEQFAPAADANPWGALVSVEEMLEGSFCFEIAAGRQHALLAAKPVRLARGVRMDVVGLVSAAPFFQADALDKAFRIVAMQMGADQMATETKHEALIAACHRHGWTTAGTLLTSWVKPQ